MKKPIISFILLILVFSVFFIYQKKTSRNLKIGFVTDFEYEEKNTEEKLGESAKELLIKAVAHYNYLFKPEIVIGGGDYVGKKENSLSNFETINSIFEKIKTEKIYCWGKKDVEYKNNFPVSYLSKIFKDTKIIVLDTTENTDPETSKGAIGQEQLVWLKKELEMNEPVLIFMHHSPIEIPNEDEWQQNLANQEEVYEIFKNNNNKIIAVFSGNGKQDYITKKSGIPFISIGGLSGINTAGRFSDIELSPNKENSQQFVLSLKNYGKNSSTYRIKRDLEISTSTRISLVEQNIDHTEQSWFDLSSSENPEGVLNTGLAGEPNLNITESGKVVAAFENKEKEGKIQVKIYFDNKWSDLADKDHPEGLVSLGKGSNPNIETKGEDIFVIFTESDYEDKTRLLKWEKETKQWRELSEEGFISEKNSHEPTLIFDNSKDNLYVAYAQKIRENSKQTQGVIKKWDGEKWETVTKSLLAFAHKRSSGVDEFDLVASRKDDSIYITYEEKEIGDQSRIRVKKWDGEKWNNLNIDKLYYEQISQLNGYSPSLSIDDSENLYLAFVENNNGPVHVYKYNENWELLKEIDSEQIAIEPFVEIGKYNILYLAFSEYKKNIVMTKNNGKNTGEELIKTNAWRVRTQKYVNENWFDLEDPFNFNGFISKGSGKGDPALKAFEDNLYLIFSDEENDYAARVKFFEDN